MMSERGSMESFVFGNRESGEEPRETGLSPEQKHALGQFFSQVNELSPQDVPNFEKMERHEMVDWMYSVIAEQADELIEKWADEGKLTRPDELISAIREKYPPKEFLDGYLTEIKKMIGNMKETFNPDSAKWETWPAAMKKSGSFNCVGASLIGTRYLEAAGIDHHIGLPSGHFVNVIKDADGWKYADFLNGLVKDVEMPTTNAEGVTMLNLDDPDSSYQRVPVVESRDGFVNSILGNLSLLKREATEASESSVNQNDLNAFSILRPYYDQLESTGNALRGLKKTLLPNMQRLSESEEMKAEHERIELLDGMDTKPMAFLSRVGEQNFELLKTIVQDIAANLGRVESYLRRNDERAVPNGMTEEANEVLRLFHQSLNEIRTKNPTVAEEAADRLMRRFRRISEK